MIRVAVTVDANACLRRIDATGHATVGKAGTSPACAAVSVLLKSVSELLIAARGITASGEAPKPGVLRLRILEAYPERQEFLAGVTALLLQGLRDTVDQAPREVEISIDSTG